MTHSAQRRERFEEMKSRIVHHDIKNGIEYIDERMALDFIDSEVERAVLEERKRCLQALPPERIIHEYMPSQNTGENRGWNEYRNAAIIVLSPSKQHE